MPENFNMSRQAQEIKQWILKGDSVLETAMTTFLYVPENLDTVVFHCQFAVESYLKAYLIFQSAETFSHDIIYLANLIIQKDSEFMNYYNSIAELQKYVQELRYPDDPAKLSNDKVQKALTIAKNLRGFIIRETNIAIEYNDILDK